MGQTQKIQFPNFSWINIGKPTDEEINNLGQKFKFHPLDLTDCITANHRSKIDVYDKYIFLVLLFPIYDRKTREIKPAEIDIFISKKYIITIQNEELTVFNDFFNLFRLSQDMRQDYENKSPEKLLYELLNRLFLYCFPMIDHLIIDCNNIEEAIFSGKEKTMISEILIIRRNITDFRKIMQVHKNIMKKTIINFKNSQMFNMKKTDAYYESLVDYTKELWDTLENLKERIEALQQTNESQISFKLSDIMRILTIISVITFPITLLATVFGMNTVHSMPFLDTEYGFWYIILIMITIMVGMIAVFKKKGWM